MIIKQNCYDLYQKKAEPILDLYLTVQVCMQIKNLESLKKRKGWGMGHAQLYGPHDPTSLTPAILSCYHSGDCFLGKETKSKLKISKLLDFKNLPPLNFYYKDYMEYTSRSCMILSIKVF